MRRLRDTGASAFILPSSSTSVASQLEDILAGIQASFSQVVTEYNAEVYPILSSLSQGRLDSRWSLSSNETCARINGLDGKTLLVDHSAAQGIDGGRYWNTSLLRPKTVKESLVALYAEVQTQINVLRGEFASQIGTGITAVQQARIGMNLFDSTLPSAAGSLDVKTTNNQQNLIQLAKDLYGASWSVDDDGSANLATSLRDAVNTLLTLHTLPNI